MPRRSCPTARCSSQADLARRSSREGELYDPATGLWTRPAAWVPRDTPIPRRSCPTARCLSLVAVTLRKSTIRRLGCGARRTGWVPHDLYIPRRSCPTARCLSLGELIHSIFPRKARNSMIRRPVHWNCPAQHRSRASSVLTCRSRGLPESNADSVVRIRNIPLPSPSITT